MADFHHAMAKLLEFACQQGRAALCHHPNITYAI
jgi:hypothetical protein